MIAAMPLAQTMPGTEIVPLVLACSIVGWIAGIAGVVLPMTRASRRLALVMAILAAGSALLVSVLFFMAHGFNPSRTISSARRHWLVVIVHAVPLILSIVAIVLLYARGAIRPAR